MRKSRALIFTLVAVVLVCALQFAAAGPTYAAGWVISPSPTKDNQDYLQGIAAVSASDIWAVGEYDGGAAGNDGTRTLTEHWNGSAWHTVASPNLSTTSNPADYLYGVAAASSSNVWAVGEYYNESANAVLSLVERWNGSTWHIVSTPIVGVDSSLHSVAALSATNVWAVGYYIPNVTSGLVNTLVEHWNGSQWSAITSPSPQGQDAYLYGITAISASNIWAVGCEGDDCSINPLIEHWNGSTWSIVASPNPGTGAGANLRSIAAVSAHDIWAVGYTNNFGSITNDTLTEHWNGSKWSIVASPSPGTALSSLWGVTAVSTGNVWAVGDYFLNAASGDQDVPLVEHWNGSSWHVAGTPTITTGLSDLYGVTNVRQTGQPWAVGYYLNESNDVFRTLIETRL